MSHEIERYLCILYLTEKKIKLFCNIKSLGLESQNLERILKLLQLIIPCFSYSNKSHNPILFFPSIFLLPGSIFGTQLHSFIHGCLYLNMRPKRGSFVYWLLGFLYVISCSSYKNTGVISGSVNSQSMSY